MSQLKAEACDPQLPEVKLLSRPRFADARGWFMELSRDSQLQELLGLPADLHFVQSNLSLSKTGVLRGLHFQHPHAQGKLVQALSGEIIDAAVDIRVGSPSFGRSAVVTLSAENGAALWIPPGFAHGFYVKKGPTLVVYQCTDYYHPECGRTLRWSDPALHQPFGIISEPILSSADQQAPSLQELAEQGLLPQYA